MGDKLEGKVALVTAGGSGLGRASAIELAARGCSIMVSDLSAQSAAAVAEEIRAAGGTADSIACDIGVEAQIEAAVGAALAAFGRLDIQHNNAALISLKSIEEDTDILGIPTETWDDSMRVTLRGTMLSCRYAIKAMLKTGGGSIINTASMYGVMPHHLQPAYCTAKAGVIYLTKQVATAFGRQGIRCNVVAPSMIKTPTLVAATPDPIIQLNAEQTLTPFLGEPEDIANIVAFLASDDARYITGHLICADGGSTVHLPSYASSKAYFGES